MKNKSVIFISLGLANVIHAILHFIQFIQSLLWISSNENEKIEEILHSPIFSIIWLIVGIISLWIGIKDFRHHKKCE